MTLEELTQLAAVQQQIITRHDREIIDIRETLQRTATQHEHWQAGIDATLDTVGKRLDAVGEQLDAVGKRLDNVAAQQEINSQQIASFMAGLVELRSLVTDYLRGRSGA